MKKVIVIAGVASILMSACMNTKLATYTDDVYANPADEKREQARLVAEQKKKEQELAKKKQEELAAQKAKDDANPLYKDASYSKDDYYDYQYASRVKRFNNPVSGLGFYDNYYTNTYSYNNNPSMYGNSIYGSYNWWPSNYFGNSCGCGNSYSNYGYSNGYNYNPYSSYGYGNPYNSYGYGNSYGMGYMNGYNNGYNNGYYGYPYGGSYYGNGYNSNTNGNWGYYNSYDANSSYGKTNAPRGSHDGGNGGRMSSPGKPYEEGLVTKYIQGVTNAQANSPKFTEVTRVNSGGRNNEAGNNNFIPVNTINSDPGRPNGNSFNSSDNSNQPRGSQNNSFGTNDNGLNNNTNQPHIINTNNSNPKGNTGFQQSEPVQFNEPRNPRGNVFDQQPTRSDNGGFSSPSTSPSTSPRGGGDTGGGGNNRPR